jgi:iron complex outermembrane recepter protein
MNVKNWLVAIALAATFQTVSFKAAAEHSISGVVKDTSGKPIAGALIEIHGTRLTTITNARGEFTFSEASDHVDELHISAPGYNHINVSLLEVAKNPASSSNSASEATEAAQQNDFFDITLQKALIERIHVTATPLHGSTLESATPITVISDLDLKNKHAPTLGETLKGELGVHSSYYGPVSSTPIIRGLDGPRVLIAQNGLDVGDASRVGPDHVVATESSTVKQIEVLRGPATLFYGSGAIGGVVNVVDNRVPQIVEHTKEFKVTYGSVADQFEASAVLNGGIGLSSGAEIAWHFDAFYRDSGDYKVPGNPINESAAHDDHDEHEEALEDEHGDDHDNHDDHKIENSSSTAKGFNVGASWILDNGFVGGSVGVIERIYGIPGHAHGADEGEHAEGDVFDGDIHEEDEHHDDEHAEEGVLGDMSQTRVQVISEFALNNDWFSGINSKFALTQYTHKEIEDGAIGTIFENDSWQLRTDLLLNEFSEWHGALTFDVKQSDFMAIGDEAFTPPSKTTSAALGLLEEKHFGDVLVQLGARIEHVDIDAELVSQKLNQSFQPISLSAGLVYDFASGYNVGLSYTHSSRAPSASELFAFGPHIGTNSYEVGATYDFLLEDEDHDDHDADHETDPGTENGVEHEESHEIDEVFELHTGALTEETSNNIELSLRKFEGNTGFTINVFYNQVENFYFQQNTGLLFDGEHLEIVHAEEHVDEHIDEEPVGEETTDEHEEHEDLLPIYHFQAQDAEFYGIEAQFVWQATDAFKVNLQADSINGKLKSGEYLPRIPPMRAGAKFNYDWTNTSLEVGIMHNFEQTKTAELETATDAYTLVDLRLNHTLSLREQDVDLYFKVDNLFNEEARVHTSFLKDQTLMPARNISLGVSVVF